MNLIRRFAVAALIALAACVPLQLTPAGATVNSSTNKTIALGTGSATQFSFSFIGVAAAYISVILTDAGGTETVLTRGSGTTQYQIVLNPAVQGAIWGVGGTVTYNPSGVPIPAGSTLTIFRTLPLTQAITLQNQSSIATLGKGAETGLDTSVMQSQQISENIARAIVAPVSDPTPPAPLPTIAQRANQGAAFDGDGNLVAGAMPASGAISTSMQPVVNAATLALGRTAFGLGSLAVENIGNGLADDGSGNVRVLSVLREVAVNQSVTVANHTNVYMASGALTFALDRANTMFNGYTFTVYALTAAVTLTPNANDNFTGQSSGVALVLPKGTIATLSTNAATSGTWFAETSVAPIRQTLPTLSIATIGSHSGGMSANASGTYTPPTGVLWIRIRMVGGGAGGGGGNNSTPSTNGTATVFSGGSLVANGGTGSAGGSGIAGGVGGAASGGNVANIPGSSGTGTPGIVGAGGSPGGSSYFGGGGGGGGALSGAGLAGATNSGGGGGGGGSGSGGNIAAGGGGGGGYVEHIIQLPAASYTYIIGPGGAGATGTAAGNGGLGAGGQLIIEEYYAS